MTIFHHKKEHLKYPLLQSFQFTQKTMNTIAKIKKTQNTIHADSNHVSTESAALIGSNDDLLIEILLRLPVTSVLRFKSVSKHWCSLLSHRHFTLLYKNASSSPGLFAHNLYIPFDNENKKIPPFRDLDFYPDPHGIQIVQSCNGLLLCCSNEGNERVRKYYVFNPTTKQFAVIPTVLGGMAVHKAIFFMALAFHQTDCVHYKVVCFYLSKPDDLLKIQIYSSDRENDLKAQLSFQTSFSPSDTRKWKISDESLCFPDPFLAAFHYIVYWNQAIHWAPYWENQTYFKIDTEELQSLPMPVVVASSESYEKWDVPLYFGESRGHLHMVKKQRVDHGESHIKLNVFEMLNDHSGWFLKYQVDLGEIRDAYPERRGYCKWIPFYYDFEVFDVVRGEHEEEEEETFMVIRVPGKVIRISEASWLSNY
uniref:F-box domain-containing protein n=1 Tax=Lactuca sativa TaxID=4236 RepID=A0A9R1WWU7_LACSA|nr:hypothetical protein LSAT_V11C900477610 [Lactuca sativa]